MDTDLDLSEQKHNEQSEKIAVHMNTKLGDTTQEFNLKDLRNIKYFAAQLSGRWKIGGIIRICSSELQFDVSELTLLIFVQNNNAIAVSYPLERLPYFCNAVDYLAESVACSVFEKYITQRKPAVQKGQATKLLRTVQYTPCLQALQNVFGPKNAKSRQMDLFVNTNWKTLSPYFWIRNPVVAANVFLKNYNPSGYIGSLLQCRGHKNLHILWQYIIEEKVYERYPQIITTICQPPQDCWKPFNISGSSADLFASIVADAIRIMHAKDETIKPVQYAYTLLRQYGFPGTGSGQLNFVISMLQIYMRLNKEICAPLAADTHCSLIELFCKNIGAFWACKKNGSFEARLKTTNADNEMDILILLIEIDAPRACAAKLCELWVPKLHWSHSEWITKKLPQRLSVNDIRGGLIDAIVSGITVMKYSSDIDVEVMKQYAEFVNKYV